MDRNTVSIAFYDFVSLSVTLTSTEGHLRMTNSSTVTHKSSKGFNGSAVFHHYKIENACSMFVYLLSLNRMGKCTGLRGTMQQLMAKTWLGSPVGAHLRVIKICSFSRPNRNKNEQETYVRKQLSLSISPSLYCFLSTPPPPPNQSSLFSFSRRKQIQNG